VTSPADSGEPRYRTAGTSGLVQLVVADSRRGRGYVVKRLTMCFDLGRRQSFGEMMAR
jgi:hypothetical protein